jgi:hypothetical protein
MSGLVVTPRSRLTKCQQKKQKKTARAREHQTMRRGVKGRSERGTTNHVSLPRLSLPRLGQKEPRALTLTQSRCSYFAPPLELAQRARAWRRRHPPQKKKLST